MKNLHPYLKKFGEQGFKVDFSANFAYIHQNKYPTWQLIFKKASELK